MTTDITTQELPEGADLLAIAQQALEDFKAVDTVVLDVRELSSVMDWLIVASGTSCLLYTSPSPRDGLLSRMPSSA